MVKAATMVGLLFAAAVVIPLACSPFGGSAFSCDDNTDCAGGEGGGFCELTQGFCAFPDPDCPLGRYGSLAGGGFADQCVGGTPDDGPPPDTQEPDGPPVDPEDVCFGTTGGLNEPCFDPMEAPTDAVTFAANTTIDTDSSALCSTVVKNSTACVVAGTTLTIDPGVTVTATGAKPLVLLATVGAVTVNGVVDVASHVGVAAIGAGGNAGTCDPGNAAGTSAGGAGGSHGALGGVGGDGVGVANSGGDPGVVSGTITTLRGGCRGQNGQQGAGAAGAGGNGGGAVYLIGETAITVGAAGQINASGAGATGGVNGSAGGGGGGSGGTIGLDAPTITNGGQIFAHGGGGAAGAGTGSTGGSGGDPTFAAGGAAGIPGGNGAVGGAGATGATGSPGGNSATRGGGGGGGSTGIIRVFGGGAPGGQVSPNPS